MKHIYSFWKRMLVVCGVAFLSMSMYSCGEDYDDTALWGAVENLEERVAKLEQQMNDQINNLSIIATLQEALTKLEGDVTANAEDIEELVNALGGVSTSIEDINKILDDLKKGNIALEEAIGKLGFGISAYTYNEETGMYDIVLSNGETISVVADCDAIELIEVKKGDDGNLYWAVDGEFLTDENGKNIPVYKAPQIRINEQTKEYEASFDGTNWAGLGLYMSENGGTTTEKPGPGGLFTSVEVDDQYAYFTMLDGTEFKVALVTENAIAPSMDVQFAKGKEFFQAGETKSVAMTMKNAEKNIIVKPEGWKAVLAADQKSMNITAPAEGVGETEGYVKIFTVSADGKSAIAEIKVVIGEANLTLAATEDGKFSITVSEDALAGAEDGTWGGYLYGINSLEEGATLQSLYDDLAASFQPYWPTQEYQSLSGDMLEYMWWEESLRPGVTYVVYAIEIIASTDGTSMGATVSAFEDMYYTTLTLAQYDVVFGDSTVSDIPVEITSAGVEGIYAIPTYFDEKWGGTIEDEIESAISQISWGGVPTLEGGQYTGTWKGLYNLVNGYNSNLSQGTTYAVIIFPVDNVTAEAAKYATGKAKTMVLGETEADVTISDITVTQTTMEALITPNDACEIYKFVYVTEDEYAAMATDEDKFNKVKDNYSALSEPDTAYRGSLNPDTTMYLLVLAIDAQGNSKLIVEKITTEAVVFSTETVAVEIKEGSVDVSSAVLKITPSAGVQSLKYAAIEDSSFNSTYGPWYNDPEIANQVMALGTNRNIKALSLNETGEYLIEGLSVFTKMHIFVTGIDADGKPTNAAYVIADTNEPFDNNFVRTANIKVKDVLYYQTEDSFDNEMAVWERVSAFSSVEEMNGINAFVKLDVDWGDIEVKNVWLWHGYASDLNEDDDLGNTKTIIKKRAASYYASTVPYQISQSRCYIREADWVYDDEEGYVQVYGPQTLYLAFQDVEGNYYPLQTYIIDDFVGGGESDAEAINFVGSSEYVAVEDWNEDGSEYLFTFGDADMNMVVFDVMLPTPYQMEGTFTAKDMILEYCSYQSADGTIASLFTDDATVTITCTDATNYLYDVVGSATLENGMKLNFSYSGYLGVY